MNNILYVAISQIVVGEMFGSLSAFLYTSFAERRFWRDLFVEVLTVYKMHNILFHFARHSCQITGAHLIFLKVEPSICHF